MHLLSIIKTISNYLCHGSWYFVWLQFGENDNSRPLSCENMQRVILTKSKFKKKSTIYDIYNNQIQTNIKRLQDKR